MPWVTSAVEVSHKLGSFLYLDCSFPYQIATTGTAMQGPSSTGIQMDVLKRQEQLDLKEKELNAKEAELKRQQEQMIADGTLKPKKNWPKCYPVTKHDIAGEVSLFQDLLCSQSEMRKS